MAAYGSTTSIMIEEVKRLKKEISILTKERDLLKMELRTSKKGTNITTKSETVGPKPKRKRVPVQPATNNKK